MFQTYERWPDIAKKHYNISLDQINVEKTNHIVFAGMGGSGSLSDIFSSILSKTEIHIDVVKGYQLPSTVSSKTLVVTTSVSGNTQETLSILESAFKKKCPIIAFSNGGKIEKFCKENKVEHRKIELYHSPRASFTSFLYSMLKVLHPILPIKINDVYESITKLSETRKSISYNNLDKSNDALVLAKWISNFPIIYYPWGLQAAALRFKIRCKKIQKNMQ